MSPIRVYLPKLSSMRFHSLFALLGEHCSNYNSVRASDPLPMEEDQLPRLSPQHLQISHPCQRIRVSSNSSVPLECSCKSVKMYFLFSSAIRGSLLLVPIVGFTWIFGAFAINSTDTPSLVFNWLFVLFNGLQVHTLLFIDHVVVVVVIYFYSRVSSYFSCIAS